MRFMMMVKATWDYEAGAPPNPELMAAMTKLTAESRQAGTLLEIGGLMPSAKGARLTLAGGKVTVTDGPFPETKELIGGYAIILANSKAEAIEYGNRFMEVHAAILGPSHEGELEIRQMFDGTGGCGEFTPEPREHEEHTREQISKFGRPATVQA